MAAAPASPLNDADRTPDYFELFGLPRRFGIDRGWLERRFYELSRESHPDRFAAQGGEAARQALARMSLLNDAYRTLKSPTALRSYVLRLEGLDAPASGPGQSAASGRMPVALAESWFELQDALTEAPEQAGARVAAFERELAELKRQGAEHVAELERQLDEGHASRAALLGELSEEIRHEAYLRSLERDVERIRARFRAVGA